MREIEAGPTVVACAQAKFPERVTELERRFNARVRELEGVERENAIVGGEVERLRHAVEVLREQNTTLERSRDALVLAVGEGEGELADTVHEQRERANYAERKVNDLEREMGEAVKREELLLEEMAELQKKLKAMEERAERAEGKGA